MKNKNLIGLIVSAALLAAAVLLCSPAVAASLPAGVAQVLQRMPFSAASGEGIGADAVLAALLSFAVCGIAATAVGYLLGCFKLKNNRAETVRVLLVKLLRFAIWAAGIVSALGCLGVDTTTIFVSVGIVGIIIGFGAQSLIEDIITGLFIILDGNFAIGDIVAIDGFRGEVKSIGLRTVSIQDAGGNIRIINNSEVGSVVNLSDATSAAVVNVPVGYDVPLADAEAALTEALQNLAEQQSELFASAPVYKGVELLTETHIELLVVAYVKEADVYTARRALQRAIRLSFEKAGFGAPTTA